MSKFDSLPARILLRNGGLLIIPPMVITFGLWGVLPAAYGPDLFWKEIPGWLSVLENTFRILVFSLPFILYFGKKEKSQPLGWILYFAGLAIYLASYLAQVGFPASAWSRSAIGFTAPAWSTVFWFAGIGLVCARSWLPIPWHRGIYLGAPPSFLYFILGIRGWFISTWFIDSRTRCQTK